MILALDPGGVTGAATWDGEHRSFEIKDGFVGFARWADAFLHWHHVTDVVVESFIVNANTHRKDPTAFETTTSIIGAARYLAFERTIHYHRQPPSAKAFGDDAKLRTLGWFHPSKGGHRNDASRHLLRHLVHAKNPEIMEALRAAL